MRFLRLLLSDTAASMVTRAARPEIDADPRTYSEDLGRAYWRQSTGGRVYEVAKLFEVSATVRPVALR